MKAAVVQELGKSPVYGEFPDPVAETNEVLIHVDAAALSNAVRSRAAGVHYTATGVVPFVVGIDGVGRLDDGRRVFFVLPRAPYGSISERTVVSAAQVVGLPDELGTIAAAALGNPGMSSWAALVERAHFQLGESVLINGATGSAGRLAVQIAKHLGARRVVATGRNADALAAAAGVGADATILLGTDQDSFEQAVASEIRGNGVDVVLDYLWGWSAERILAACAKSSTDSRPIRFVSIGSLSGPSITLPSAALRAVAMTLMGSGIGSVPGDRLMASIGGVLRAAVPAGFKVDTQVVPLSQVESVWSTGQTVPRIVFRVS
jgi:NADPH:quinone reductase-like Zn-dependent oxidoreductase